MLTKPLEHSPRGGREMLSKLNYDILCSHFGEHLFVYELSPSPPRDLLGIINSFRGYIDGLTPQAVENIVSHIDSQNISCVFVDGSNLGRFVQVLKRRLDNVEVITFFHNVESRFFWGGFLYAKSIRAMAILISNFFVERKATLLSDKRICLSVRDSSLLKRLYGKGATHISPIALKDQLVSIPFDTRLSTANPFALFVGGSFYANRDGISWFVRNVVPHVHMKICIVGKGMEDMRSKLEIPGRVEVIGSIDSLSELYRRSLFVIAPIFDGSGMKTKVAEALMHGKKVVGTPEAFSGYENVSDRAGWCCSSTAEFVSAFNEASSTITLSFDPELRSLYEEYFSLPAATVRLSEALGDNRDA